MLFFAFLPAPLAMLLIIPVVVMSLYNILFFKVNKYEVNKAGKLGTQIIRITNIALVYMVIMAIFRNDNIAIGWVGCVGANVLLAILYVGLISAYLLFKEKYISKRELYYLAAAALLSRIMISPYLQNFSYSVILIIVVFALLCLSQHHFYRNSAVIEEKSTNSRINLFEKKYMQKNLILGLILIITIVFTGGKVFLTESEKKAKKIQQQIKYSQQ